MLVAVYTHFGECPDFMVYDNACHMHVSALNRYVRISTMDILPMPMTFAHPWSRTADNHREPEFFKFVRMIIDRFHAKAHTCSPAFTRADPYPTLHEANTSGSEHFHSILAKMKRMASHLDQASFMFCLDILMWK